MKSIFIFLYLFFCISCKIHRLLTCCYLRLFFYFLLFKIFLTFLFYLFFLHSYLLQLLIPLSFNLFQSLSLCICCKSCCLFLLVNKTKSSFFCRSLLLLILFYIFLNIFNLFYIFPFFSLFHLFHLFCIFPTNFNCFLLFFLFFFFFLFFIWLFFFH